MNVGWEWMHRRTKRLADLLLFYPRILAGAIQVVELLDRYCELNDIPEASIGIGEAIFVRGLDYVSYPLEVA